MDCLSTRGTWVAIFTSTSWFPAWSNFLPIPFACFCWIAGEGKNVTVPPCSSVESLVCVQSLPSALAGKVVDLYLWFEHSFFHWVSIFMKSLLIRSTKWNVLWKKSCNCKLTTNCMGITPMPLISASKLCVRTVYFNSEKINAIELYINHSNVLKAY